MSKERKERTYQKTHPWINFTIDPRKLDYLDWILFGEAKSKCLHIIGAPLLPKIKDSLFQMSLVKGALATTAIEGNTLTEEEVNRRIQGKLKLSPSKEYLGIEIDNVVKAYNIIGQRVVLKDMTKFEMDSIKEFNKLVLNNLPLDEGIIPGEIRQYSVSVGGYPGAPPEDCEFLLDKYIQWLNTKYDGPESQEMIFGILKAIMAHLYFVWIHPFGNGNGRTARLIEFQILLSAGVPAASAHLMSNHYNSTRSEYYRNLDFSSKSGGEFSHFIKYSLQGFVDGLKDQIDIIQNQQLYVHWINHVHNIFTDKDRSEDKRRRTLVLALTEIVNEKPLNEVRHLSPKIAEMYANLSDKTVQRDIEKLIDLDLVIRGEKGFRAKVEILNSYLTPVKPINKPKLPKGK